MSQQSNVLPHPARFRELYSEITKELKNWQEHVDGREDKRMFQDAISALQTAEKIINNLSSE